MTQLVWIHRFNGNELGLRGAGAFCLVPVKAREIFKIDKDQAEVKVYLDSLGKSFDLSYTIPLSKTEHRLSLSKLRTMIGDEDSGSLIRPGRLGVFFRKENRIHFLLEDEGGPWGYLLEELRKNNNNNIVTEIVLSNAEEEGISKASKFALPKPFLLLAGISGTGKSRFVREQAKAWDASLETYCLVSVRPDWHEPSDLMGYVSRLGQRPQYVATDVLRFMVRAWQEVIESVKRDDQGRPVRWLGRDLDQIRPFWLCLDEMNLAPVEQYFADYLSVLETRSWTYAEPSEATSYSYSCDPLIKGSVFSSLDVGMTDDDLKPSDLLAQDLGLNLELPLDKDIWDLFLQEGIGIPFNLIVAGTVNMDETTHGFSRKVIDRALSFDFGDFFPNNFEQFFEPAVFNKILTYPTQSHADRSTLSTTIDSDGALSIQFLGKVNEVLKGTPFELAYRALNELLLAVMSAQPKDEATLQAVWDDFLMCKVLPRLEGDIDKLGGAHSLLEQLEEVLPVELDSIWSPSTESATRPDLYREYKVTDSDSVMTSSEVLIACRTRAKLGWMRKRLESSGFTSFWP